MVANCFEFGLMTLKGKNSLTYNLPGKNGSPLYFTSESKPYHVKDLSGQIDTLFKTSVPKFLISGASHALKPII